METDFGNQNHGFSGSCIPHLGFFETPEDGIGVQVPPGLSLKSLSGLNRLA